MLLGGIMDTIGEPWFMALMGALLVGLIILMVVMQKKKGRE